MIVPRYQQRTIYEGIYRTLIPDQKALLWERWLLKIDALLDDEALVGLVQRALERRHPQSRTRGRKGTPAEVVLRLLVLKHLQNWSYATLEREVRANLIYRDFTRIGGEAVPDAKTMVRLGQALGPALIRQLHARVVQLARGERVVTGRKLRLDTTVVETNIHYPTDSSLLGDGARVLTRTMQQIQAEVGAAGTAVRNRLRSITHRLIEIGKASRGRGAAALARQQQAYGKLMTITQRILGQAKRVAHEVRQGIKRAPTALGQVLVEGLAQHLDAVSALTRRVLVQTRARVFEGNTHFPGRLLSLFETTTEAIRKGKAAKPTEFGKLVKIQEAEHQVVTAYEIYAERPTDPSLLLPAIAKHEEVFARAPELVAADAGFFSAENEQQAQEVGVEKIAIPNKQTRSPARWAVQRQRWFKRAQRWRVGCEGRISVLKRRHGLCRCRYKGVAGMERWVGLGVMANNLLAIARVTIK
ncbi:MAG TPA: ISNCY family transposase [archaeon]|nr:ISNCY family transposase [archaeon]